MKKTVRDGKLTIVSSKKQKRGKLPRTKSVDKFVASLPSYNGDRVATVVLETKDYDKFNSFIANRADSDGKGRVDKGRVDRIKDKITTGKWIDLFGLIYVNKDFVIIDGHHTFEARKWLGYPIYYIILTCDEVNPKGKTVKERNKELAVVISSLNDTNTSWTPLEIYNVALFFKLDVAVKIEELRVYISKVSGVRLSKITRRHVFALISGDALNFSGGDRADVETYDNKQMVIDAMSTTCKNAVDFYCEVLKLIHDKGTTNKVFSVIFKSYFSKYLDTERFIKNLKDRINTIEFGTKLNVIADTLNMVYNADKRTWKDHVFGK